MKPPPFSAILSYSHSDRKAARWIHSQLEGYQFPAGTLDLNGDKPEPVSPVFMDRAELQAGPSLSDGIEEALANSEALVVLCSKKAAQSKWVNLEIEKFRALRGVNSDRIFAVILDGKPSVPAGADEACYPAALYLANETSADVMAPDLRPQGDGKRLSLLKLIAGLSRVRLDDLVQRDQQRAIKRLRWMMSGCVALLLVFAGLGTALYFAEQKAIRQRDMAREVRDGAQKLNTFFIGDLRSKLRSVGRLDLLEDATTKVLEYHEALPLEMADDPEVQRARAMAMDYKGQLEMTRGDPAKAIESLKKSQEAWLALQNRPDSRGNAWQGFAVSSKILGEAYGAAGDSTGELKAYDDGLVALEGLRPTLPGDEPLLKRSKSMLLAARGGVQYRKGNAAKALTDLDMAAALAKEAVEAAPKDIANWNQAIDAFKRLADYYIEVRDFDIGLTQAKAAVEAAETVGNLDLKNTDAWSRIADTQGTLMMVHQARREWPEAEAAAKDALQWRTQVFSRDPSNPEAEARLAMAHDNLAVSMSFQKGDEKLEGTLSNFDTAFLKLLNLVQRYPSRNDWRRSLGIVAKRQGDFAFESNVWGMALERYETSQKVREYAVAYAPTDIRLRVELANIHIARGEALFEMKKKEEAIAAIKKAGELLADPVIPADYPAADELRKSVVSALSEFKTK